MDAFIDNWVLVTNFEADILHMKDIAFYENNQDDSKFEQRVIASKLPTQRPAKNKFKQTSTYKLPISHKRINKPIQLNSANNWT